MVCDLYQMVNCNFYLVLKVLSGLLQLTYTEKMLYWRMITSTNNKTRTCFSTTNISSIMKQLTIGKLLNSNDMQWKLLKIMVCPNAHRYNNRYITLLSTFLQDYRICSSHTTVQIITICLKMWSSLTSETLHIALF